MSKQYVGRGKVVGKFNHLKIGIRVADLTPNAKGYVNLIVGELKQPDDYGNTHSVWVDDWVPNKQQEQPSVSATAPSPSVDPDSDLPF